MDYTRRALKWQGWGQVGERYDEAKTAAFRRYLAERLGRDFSRVVWPPVALENVRPPASRLRAADRKALAAAVGAEHVHVDDYERLFHAYGKSLHDLLRIRQGVLEAAPDAAVYPGDARQTAAVLAWAAKAGWAVVPFGGGSSVVGGVEARDPAGRPTLTLDMTRMNRMLAIHPQNRAATFEAGVYGPQLEAALNPLGWSLDHAPQSFEYSTLGGWIAARSAGQQSNQFGRIDELLVCCRVVAPSGELTTLCVPASAAGPDLNAVIAGSEGRMGVIVEATVSIHPRPRARTIKAVLFPSFADGAAATAAIVHDGLRLSYLRLSDEEETASYLALGGHSALKRLGLSALSALGYGERRSVLLVGAEGEPDDVARDVSRALCVAKRHGGMNLGEGPARGWHRDRFRHPYLRDDLLDYGVAVETLETAATWDRALPLVASVKGAIRAALGRRGEQALALTHLSHSYPSGSCIYFIIMYPLDRADPVGQWRTLKTAASDAVAAAGGTISHHHGVGRDHLRWADAEKGPLGRELVAALARAADPSGVMNPGKLTGEG